MVLVNSWAGGAYPGMGFVLQGSDLPVDATDAIDTLEPARLRAGSLAIATELLVPLRQLRPFASLPTPTTSTTTGPAVPAPPPMERHEVKAETEASPPAGADLAVEKAEAAKARGNAAFDARDFASAVKHYSMAIRLHPTNHILWSNRSAAHCAVRAQLACDTRDRSFSSPRSVVCIKILPHGCRREC